jgi:hypothetical protein
MSTTRLTPHFLVSEFDCRDGSPLPLRLVPAARFVCEWWLEPMRSRFGPITIHSGYRSATHNAQVGGASASVHLGRTEMPRHAGPPVVYALAADVGARDGSPSTWARWALEHRRRHPHLGPRGRGGIGRYSTQGFVHLDTAAARDWKR